MADVRDSPLTELSELSEAESLTTDEEIESGKLRGTLDSWVKAGLQVSKKKRPASPPHDYAPEDDSSIAVIVMFRSRFTDAFSKTLPNYGPQDIERGVLGAEPEEMVERLLAALLSLCLNRKKDVEKGHYNRALEEAITTFSRQWPSIWQGKNPLAGGTTFKSMIPEKRLSLLLALVHWCLANSEVVRQIIAESYKGSRDMQDKGQPLSVQPWGNDGDKRRYWLIEGLDDTFFRIYRENDPKLIRRTWWSVAKDIDGAKALADKLCEDGSQAAKQLANGIGQAIPRWELGEEKKRRREYRQIRKAQFTRPEPGISLYEGRTRGKRTRYTFSEDDEDVDSDEQSNKRSRRSGRITPAEHDEPVITASGRQVKARNGGLYGESLLSGQQHLVERGSSDAENSKFRTRSGRGAETSRISQRKNYTGADGVNDDIDSDIPSEEWNSDQNDVDDLNDNLADVEDDEDEDMSDGGLDDDDVEIAQPTKIITIKLGEQTSARLARSRQDEEQRQQNSSIRQNGSSITFSNEEGLRALPLQSIILTTAAEAKAKSNVDQSEDVSNSDTTQVSFTSNSPAPIRVKDDQFTNGIVQIESSPSQSRLMNGIFKPHSPAAIFGGPIASDQIKTSKLEEPRFLQTLTPP